ncbi:MAG TPA: alpha/beta hydrolase [Candidatus Aquilonibacter sp.]|nr:alpha/beta hydrolase [Candidatus Aquilonibacter sp.]
MIARRVEAAIPPAGRFIEIAGNRVHYIDRGDGPPLVLVHGLAGVMQNFTHSLVDRLTSRFRVIAIDRTGAGYSVRARDAGASIAAQAATLGGFIEALGLDRPLVCGHSLGAAYALALAIDRPKLARALALIAPYTQPERRAPAPFTALEIESRWQRALIAHTVAVPLSMMHGARVVRQIFSPEAVPDDFAIAGGGLLGLRASQFFHASSDMIAARDDMPALVMRYGEVGVPVHVLFGIEDAVLDYRRHGETFRTQIPNADLRLVHGGHMLPVTQPDLVAAWLDSIV